jgi:hypothetical protein
MANKIKLDSSVNISDININVPECPGCGREHDLTPRKPTGAQNCGRGFGVFHIKIVNLAGFIEVEVQFEDNQFHQVDISKQVFVTIRKE